MYDDTMKCQTVAFESQGIEHALNNVKNRQKLKFSIIYVYKLIT